MDLPKRQASSTSRFPRKKSHVDGTRAMEANENTTPRRSVPTRSASPLRKKVLVERNDDISGSMGRARRCSLRSTRAYPANTHRWPRPDFLRYEPMTRSGATRSTAAARNGSASNRAAPRYELESMLAAKQASLPKEPLPNAEVVTVVVRMPDDIRQGRCFLKSDQLQVLSAFIDISRTFKPGTYRPVYYPRHAFTYEECQMSLSDDVGLTSKQEALFLEQIQDGG